MIDEAIIIIIALGFVGIGAFTYGFSIGFSSKFSWTIIQLIFGKLRKIDKTDDKRNGGVK